MFSVVAKEWQIDSTTVNIFHSLPSRTAMTKSWSPIRQAHLKDCRYTENVANQSVRSTARFRNLAVLRIAVATNDLGMRLTKPTVDLEAIRKQYHEAAEESGETTTKGMWT